MSLARPLRLLLLVAVVTLAIGDASRARAQPADAPVDPYGQAPAPAPAPRPAPAPARPDEPLEPYGGTPPARPAAPPASPRLPAAPPASPRLPAAPPASPRLPVAPAPPASPVAPAIGPTSDVELDEKVAAALYDRGVDLYGAADYAGAKLMFVESLERAPSGATAIDALRMLRTINEKLGLPDRDDGRPAGAGGAPPPGADGAPLDPYGEPRESALDPYGPAGAAPAARADASAGRGGLLALGGGYGLLAGLALAGPEGDGGELGGGAVLLGTLGAAAGLGGALWADRRWPMREGDRAAVVAGGLLGGLTIAFVADSLTGDETNGFETSPNAVYRSAAIGGLVGIGGGILWARGASPSAGDVALTRSVAAYGAGTGMLLGVAMDPTHSEGYTLNGALGLAAGLGAGLFLASETETSARRVLWVDLGAVAGAAAPWLLYPLFKDDGGRGDERFVGFLSSVGLIAGAATTWFWTRNVDGDRDDFPAPAAALVERTVDGRWRAGLPMPRPVRSAAAAPDRGVGVDLAVGRF